MVDVDMDPRTLSLIHAVRVIKDAIPLLRAAPDNQLPRLYRGLLIQISRGILPPRDGCINPRVWHHLNPLFLSRMISRSLSKPYWG